MTHHLTRRVHQGVHVSLLAAIACAALQPVGATGSAQPSPRPGPIEAALNLLSWPADQTPLIVVVAERPQVVNPLAEGWVVYNTNGSARSTIYVAGWSALYRDALAHPHASRHHIIRLAGVLAHERGHLRHGPDEEPAYAEQLTTLEQLQAEPIEITNVRRVLESVRRRHRARS
jgi:hypothetical protein